MHFINDFSIPNIVNGMSSNIFVQTSQTRNVQEYESTVVLHTTQQRVILNLNAELLFFCCLVDD